MGDPLVRRIANANIKPNKLQSKFLAVNHTTNGNINDLDFNNLQVGKTYHLTGWFYCQLDTGNNDDAVTININNGVTTVISFTLNNSAPDQQPDTFQVPIDIKFTATGTTIRSVATDLSANSYLIGNGSLNATSLQLEERNDVVDTTDFT